MKSLIKASVLAAIIAFGGTNAFAANAAPTIQDANEFIGDLMARGMLVGTKDGDMPFSNYRSSGCNATMKFGDKAGALQIDWPSISSVNEIPLGVSVHGGILSTMGDGSQTSKYKQADFYVADETTMRRLNKAMTLLMNSCARKSKFD